MPEFSEDRVPTPFGLRALRARFTEPDEDTFTVNRHDRGKAKTTYAAAMIEEFPDLPSLILSLPTDEAMLELTGGSKEWDFDRTPPEQRNVRVIAYVFAIAKESDNDYHLIVDDDGQIEDGAKLNVEVSGVPTEGPDAQAVLEVRNGFKAHFGGSPPKKYKKNDEFAFAPKRVLIEGSLFFDTDHPAGTVGPEGYRPGSAWEIHPVRRIVFLDE